MTSLSSNILSVSFPSPWLKHVCLYFFNYCSTNQCSERGIGSHSTYGMRSTVRSTWRPGVSRPLVYWNSKTAHLQVCGVYFHQVACIRNSAVPLVTGRFFLRDEYFIRSTAHWMIHFVVSSLKFQHWHYLLFQQSWFNYASRRVTHISMVLVILYKDLSDDP